MKINVTFDSIDEMKDFAVKIGAESKKGMDISKDKKKPSTKVMEVKPEGPKNKPKYTLTDIRAAAAEKLQEGKNTQVKELLESFEVNAVSKIPEDKFDEFMEKVGEL